MRTKVRLTPYINPGKALKSNANSTNQQGESLTPPVNNLQLNALCFQLSADPF